MDNRHKIKRVFKLLDKMLFPFKLQTNLKTMLEKNPTVAVNIRTRKIFAFKSLDKYNTEELGRLNRSSVIDAAQIIKERNKDGK